MNLSPWMIFRVIFASLPIPFTLTICVESNVVIWLVLLAEKSTKDEEFRRNGEWTWYCICSYLHLLHMAEHRWDAYFDHSLEFCMIHIDNILSDDSYRVTGHNEMSPGLKVIT